MKSTWKRIWKVLRSVISWWALGIVILIIVLYLYTLPWTGFGDYTTPPGDFVRGKTLWDWMQLLIVPFVLGVGAYYLNSSERKNERDIATDRQQEAALQAYLDRMADLLLKDKLRTTKKREVRDVARTRTLTVLRGLDKRRKGFVLRFLYEAGLISSKPIINLDKADLTGAYLAGANLRGANLTGAFVNEAFLEGVDLSDAKLNKVFLSQAFLGGANLCGADLTEAYLAKANLIGADLTGAKILEWQLESVNSLEYAILPDGTKHE